MNNNNNNDENDNNHRSYLMQRKEDYSFSNNHHSFKKNDSALNNIELNSEKEAIQVLKAQNKRMLDLTNELERKDYQVNTLQQQLTAKESYKTQAENYKRQVTILEEKLSLMNDTNSKSDYYSQQLKNVSDAENRLRSQLISKDKIIYDYDKVIKEHEKTINNLRRQALEKEGQFSSVKQELNEQNSKQKSLTSIVDSSKEEWRRFREDSEYKISELNKEKHRMEEKVAELIDIIKLQSKELNEYSLQNQISEKDNKHLSHQNTSLNQKIDELMSSNGQLKEQVYLSKDLKEKIIETEEKYRHLQRENEQLKKTNNTIQRSFQEINDNYNKLRNKASLESTVEDLKSHIEKLNKDIFNLNQSNENLSKLARHNEERSSQLETEIRDLIKNLNQEIKTIIEWCDKNLSDTKDNSSNIGDLPITSNQFIKNNIYVEGLKSSLISAKRLISKHLNNNESIIQEIKKENYNLTSKIDCLIKEMATLRNDVQHRAEDNSKLSQELKMFSGEIDFIQKEEFKMKNELFEKTEQYKKNIDKIFDKLRANLNGIFDNPRIARLYNDLSIQMTFNDNKITQIDNLLDKHFEIFNNLSSEYEVTLRVIEQNIKHKNDAEKLRKELTELKINFKEESDKFLKEKGELSKKIEKQKNEEVLNLENSFKLNSERIKQKLADKDELIEQLQAENNIIRNQLELLDKNLSNYKSSRSHVDNDAKEKYEKLQESYKAIDKKYTNLMRDIELKEIHIKSQESLLNRRVKEIEDLKRRDTSCMDDSYFIKKIQILESENDKLVKENLNMMNINSTLNSQAKGLKEHLQHTMNANIKSLKLESSDPNKENDGSFKNSEEIYHKEFFTTPSDTKRVRGNQEEELPSFNGTINKTLSNKNTDQVKGTILRKKNK